MSQKTMKMSAFTKKMFAKYKKQSTTARLSKIEKRLNTAEVKQKETYDTGVATNVAAVINEITEIGIGNDDDDRVGNSINLISIGYKLSINSNPNVFANTVRVTIVRCNVEPFDISQLFDPLVAGSIRYPLCNRNPNFIKRYRVLDDRTFTMNNAPYWDSSTNTLGHNNRRKYLEFYKKVNLPVKYKDNAAGDADVGSIYMVITCLEPVGNGISYEALCKVRYTDL